jgi:hypothetical protein
MLLRPQGPPAPAAAAAAAAAARTSRSTATSSIEGLMSQPTHTWPASVSASPLSPLPQPTSSSSRGGPLGGSASSSSARAVSDA